MITVIAGFLKQAIIQGIPLLYGSTGEIITEKSGNLNLGIPGIMYIGGISGVIGAYFYEMHGDTSNAFLTVLIPFLTSILGSVIMSLIYCFLTVTLKANQNVTGLALTTLGTGIGNFFGGSLTSLFGGEGGHIALNATGKYYQTPLPFADKLGLFGDTFLSFGFLAYLAIAIALFASWYINRTHAGLKLRSVGENPATADAAGINVSAYKYAATCIGCGISGLGGLSFIMNYLNGIWEYCIDAIGWLAIALVIFTVWKPSLAIIGSIIFGGLYIASSYITGFSIHDNELLKMLPYIVTIIVLLFTSIRDKKKN